MASTGLDYANGRIPVIFRKIFFPSLLGMIFTALITIVDGIFVGNHTASRVTAAFRLSLRVALLCGVIVTVSIFFLSGEIVSLFIPVDSEAGILASEGLPIYSFCATFFALNIAYIGYYQSMGKAAKAMTYTLLRGIILLVPLLFLLPSLYPSWGMWAAIPASELGTFLIILFNSSKESWGWSKMS